jgi:hypothetical protein
MTFSAKYETLPPKSWFSMEDGMGFSGIIERGLQPELILAIFGCNIWFLTIELCGYN